MKVEELKKTEKKQEYQGRMKVAYDRVKVKQGSHLHDFFPRIGTRSAWTVVKESKRKKEEIVP